MKAHDGMYIGGEWRPALGDGRIEVLNPADERLIASVPAGSSEDVDAAVRAARAAFPAWAATAPARRAALIGALRDVLVARKSEIAATVTAELGSPLGFSEMVHVGAPIAVASSFAELGASYAFEERIGNSTVLLEPVGVVGAITPWNYPLHQIVAKVAPALAAGCTIVLKPAEDTPLTAQLFAEAVHEAGIPAGVQPGDRHRPGHRPGPGRARGSRPRLLHRIHCGRQADRRHGRRRRQAGRPRAGRQIGQCHPARRRPRQGRRGGRGPRHEQRRPELQRPHPHARPPGPVRGGGLLAATAAAKYASGDPLDPGTRLGPVVSAKQRDRVRGFITKGMEEGARLVAGGPEAPHGQGYFIAPTVFADVTPGMTIAQEEIFGPVLSILPYEDQDEALAIANGTDYGLGGAVWAADEETAVAFARRMDTGQVDINGGRFNPLAPFGGYKKSGVGRELGPHGLAEYLQTKSLQF